MKISIIGGGGLVGSCTAAALQARNVGRQIALLDVNQEVAAGHALDLNHGSPSMADQYFFAGSMEDVRDSDVICITAGSRRQPGESRLDLIQRNTDLFRSILQQVQQAGHLDSAVVLVVSNPVDILTHIAARELSLPSSQVIGLGTQLDTIRFRSLIAAHLRVPPSQVSALILGEHGDSMVPVWSAATIASLPLEKYPGWNNGDAGRIFEQTKKSGATVIQQKGGAGFAVGVAIVDVIESIERNLQRVLPVSSLQDGSCYGLSDVSLSVPTVVGQGGVQGLVEVELWPRELQGLRQSAAALQKGMR